MPINFYVIAECKVCEQEVGRICLGEYVDKMDTEQYKDQFPTLCDAPACWEADLKREKEAERERYGPNGKTLVTRTLGCQLCQESFDIAYDESDHAKWNSGKESARGAFPYLEAWEREMLISQTCNDCWNKLYP